MTTATAPGALELLTPTGVQLTVRPETDWRRGLAIYAVAETAGSFTFTPGTRDADSLTLNYGRPVDCDVRHRGSASAWDDRPVVNGMELAGATGIDLPALRRLLSEPAYWADADWTDCLTAWPKRAYPLPSARPNTFERSRVTEAAHHRTAAIVAALARHHLARTDLAALDLARRAADAPLQIRALHISRAATEQEIARRQRQLGEYDERIASLEALIRTRGPVDIPPRMP
ncbi:hypothetical protein ACFY4B_27370 [Kitasatospora sp. NPDC001261]|uniref:hypothetical protein n=1 Tax=Kitasatospora sp. NPDC001261 TaxID=3364012 RepID=UPI0036B5E1AB